MTILDTGARQEFTSGAVRDIVDGKGRCDLLPLDVLAQYFYATDRNTSEILHNLHTYIYGGDISRLNHVITLFGCVRKCDIWTMLIEVSTHYEAGAKKYTERNWEYGMEEHWYISSGIRHYFKFKRGDTDEPHDLAFVWNILCAIRTHMTLPEFIDLPFNMIQDEKSIKLIDSILQVQKEKNNENNE